jgi:opacity protein-like surface antigen
MKPIVLAGSILAALAAASVCEVARAEDPLGFYFGGGVGQSDVRLDHSPSDNFFGFDSNHFGWKVLFGLRPIAPLGAEVEYTDYGDVSFNEPGAVAEARERSGAVYGVGYLPIGGPFLDLYGKAGLAWLRTNASGSVGPCPIVPQSSCSFRFDRSDSRFAYGAGVQVHVPGTNVSVRGEYQRIDSSLGDPALLSLGVTFRF